MHRYARRHAHAPRAASAAIGLPTPAAMRPLFPFLLLWHLAGVGAHEGASHGAPAEAEHGPASAWPPPPTASDMAPSSQATTAPASGAAARPPTSDDLVKFYSEQGFIGAGNDLEVLEDATVDEAVAACTHFPTCTGFTFQVSNDSSSTYKIFLKAHDAQVSQSTSRRP
eukprot:scaffold415_cov362-Prasinococcus_capsulatus_cf.AAC.16